MTDATTHIGDYASRSGRGGFAIPVEIPTPVYEVIKAGYSVMPQTGGEPKVPFAKWKPFQQRPATLEELTHIIGERGDDPGTWALVTGQATNLVVLDFDGDAGRALVDEWNLTPNVISRSGGVHVWVKDVPFPVRSGTVKPGMEIKGEGASVTFYGEVTEGDKPGAYDLRSAEPVSVNGLPASLREVIKGRERNGAVADHEPGDETSGLDIASVCLSRVLAAMAERRPGYEHRNESGFALFCQMRDNRVPEEGARLFIPTWVAAANSLVDKADPYTAADAEQSLAQAYSQPAREPSISRVLTKTRSGAVALADVEVKPVRWLWKGRIPLGKLTIMEGDPERGKSTITVDLGARYSAGKPMPDGEHMGQGNVLFIGAEDAIEDTVKPRFLAAEGDPYRAFYMPMPVDPETGRVRPMTFPEDLDELERVIESENIRLAIMDPVMAFLSARINSNNDASVRQALTPLAEVADRLGTAMVLVRHLNKDSGEKNARYRGGGSIAFTGAARSVMVVGEHPQQPGTLVLARTKNNLAAPVPALTYSIGSDEGGDQPVIRWGETCSLTADDLFASKDSRKDAPVRREAEQFLLDLLEAGPVPANEVQEKAKAAGIKAKTLARAKKALGIPSRNLVDRTTGEIVAWTWVLPGTVVDGEMVLPDYGD